MSKYLDIVVKRTIVIPPLGSYLPYLIRPAVQGSSKALCNCAAYVIHNFVVTEPVTGEGTPSFCISADAQQRKSERTGAQQENLDCDAI